MCLSFDTSPFLFPFAFTIIQFVLGTKSLILVFIFYFCRTSRENRQTDIILHSQNTCDEY